MDNKEVDLSGAWGQIWAKLSPEIANFTIFLIFVAIAIAVWQISAFILANRRQGGGGGNARSLTAWLVFAALLAAPAALIPLFLVIADGVIAIFIAVISLAT